MDHFKLPSFYDNKEHTHEHCSLHFSLEVLLGTLIDRAYFQDRKVRSYHAYCSFQPARILRLCLHCVHLLVLISRCIYFVKGYRGELERARTHYSIRFNYGSRTVLAIDAYYELQY